MPRHTVIIANYNYRNFVERAIQSVLEQTVQDFELVVIDDGSQDDSLDLLKNIEKKFPQKIHLFYHENRGQGFSWNRAIKLAKGDYISFLDSDDWWFPGKLEWLSLAIEKQPNASIYQHNLDLYFNDKFAGKPFQGHMVIGDYFKLTQEQNRRGFFMPVFSPTSGLSFPRDVLEKVIPIPEDFRICADGFLTRTCFCHGPVYSDVISFGAYRAHDSNSILGNITSNEKDYLNKLLFPKLNAYYKSIQVSLRLKLPDSNSPKKTLIRCLEYCLLSKNIKKDIINRELYPIQKLKNYISIKSILFIRSDRNQDALKEIKESNPDAEIDYLVNSNYQCNSSEMDYIRELITYRTSGNLNINLFNNEQLKKLRGKHYDLVLYGNSYPCPRENIRKLCRSICKYFFGYSGKQYLILESLDSIRLSLISRKKT